MAMKFQREAMSEFAITAYAQGSISVAGTEHRASILVAHATAATAWPVATFTDITSDAIAHATHVQAEIVIIGTGKTFRFLKPEAMRPLIDAKIGYEVMDTAAACRTYNVLLSEGRQVAALLLVEVL